MKWQNIIAALMLSTGPIAYPQTSQEVNTAPPPSSRFPSKWYPAPNNYSSTEVPVKGEPYAATMVTTITLSDTRGHPTVPFIVHNNMYRDSAGRTRSEEGSGLYHGADGVEHYETSFVTVSTTDPVSHCSFKWQEPWTHPNPPTATVQCFPLTVKYRSQDHLASIENQVASDDSRGQSEPLGHKMIDGFDVIGERRTTKSSPPGNANSAIEPVVVEYWLSTKLRELMWFGAVPPHTGIPQFELKDIHLGEQKPSLFYPPANYRIIQ